MDTTRQAIVVGLDDGPDSLRALDWAISEAVRRGAPLHLLHADPPGLASVPATPSEIRDMRVHADRTLADATARVADRVQVSAAAVEKPPVPALLEIAERALMLVVGARGHSSAFGLLLGSVSRHVSQHASCPVVVVREQGAPQQNRIVVGVDGSTGSDTAIGFAIEAADLAGAPLVAMHGWSDIDARMGSVHGGWPRTMRRIDAGERMLDAALAGWSAKFPTVPISREAIPNHPALVLADASGHAALVVVGSRGRGDFVGMLLGSVSQSVLHHARCPVAVVR